MPRVPTYDGPQVREAALPDVRLDPRAYQGRNQHLAGVVNLAAAGVDAYEKVQQRNDNEAAFKAEATLTADWMQHDAELRKRYRGSNVDGYQDEVDKWWADAPGKYTASLSPQAQRAAARSLTAKQLQASAGALNYYTGEKERATVGAAEAKKLSTIQMALTDGRPEAVATARKDVQATNAMEAARRGSTPDELAAANLKDLTTLHSEYINAVSVGNAAAGKAYFDKYKEEIDATRHDSIGKVLKAEGDNQQARADAAAWAKLPLEEQLAKAAEIGDPQRREKTILQIKTNHGLVKEAQAEVEKKFSDIAWQHYSKTGKLPPENILDKMDGRERDRLQETRRLRVEHMNKSAAEKAVKTDPKVLAALLDLQAENPQEFARTFRAEAYAYSLSGSDLEQMAKARQALLNPKPERDVVALNSKITARLESLEINTGAQHQEKRGAFRMAAQKAIETAIERNGGKPLTNKQEDEELDRLLIPGTVVNTWWNDSRRVFEVPETDLARFKTKSPSDEARVASLRIPAAERAAIAATLRRKGVAVTDESIVMLFNAGRAKEPKK